ncbi:hypothetical protein BJX65DRAFT_301051 [Aspergillus insuetus]
MAKANPPVNRAGFRIAILCALPLEAAAVLPLFDCTYSGYRYRRLFKLPGDENTYTLGRIGDYDSYPGIKLALILGVCGGIPVVQSSAYPTLPAGGRAEIFLGDTIVSHGVVEYDLGTQSPGGFARKDTLMASHGRARQGIRSMVAMMNASRAHLQMDLAHHLRMLQEKHHATYPGLDKDVLWQPTYDHRPVGCQCSLDASDIEEALIARRRISDVEAPLPALHFGIIASGDTVIKSAAYRDQLAVSEDVIGYEMELTGAWENLPCILIKGVADYADSHKSKEWQEYAAASSAACMRALLNLSPVPFGLEESGRDEGDTPLRKRRVEDGQHVPSSPRGGQASNLPYEPHKKLQMLDDTTSLKHLRHPSKNFVGREEFRERLRRAFAAPASPRTRRRDFVLYGAGGFGKTQICLKFAEECSSMFWKIFWIDASNAQTLDLSFRGIALDPIARANGVQDSVASVTQWLSSSQEEWLLIFDNADDGPASIEDFLVHSPCGNTLVTTRNPNMRDLADFGAFAQVTQMSESEGVQLLSRLLHLENVPSKAQEKMSMIVQELGCLPLAIQHAASAIIGGLCSLHDYLVNLKQHPFRLLGDSAMRGASYYEKNQLAAWETSLMAMQCDRNRFGSIETTLMLMRVFSFFHPNNIMEGIFQRAATTLNIASPRDNVVAASSTGPSGAKCYLPYAILSANSRGAWDPITFKTAIQALYRQSFIEIQDTGEHVYTLHPLIHAWIRRRMTADQQLATLRTATALLTASIEGQPTETDYAFCRQLLPHVHAMRSCQIELDLPAEYFDDAQKAFWTLFEVNEQWHEVRGIGLKVVEHHRTRVGSNREKEMGALARLSWTYRMLGALEKAETLQKEALAYRETSLGNEHKDTLESMAYLAWIYYDQARYKDAADLQAYVYETYKKLKYDKHVIFKAGTALSETYCGWTKWQAAVELLEVAVGDMQAELDPDSVTTVDAKASLAVAYHELYLLKEAERIKLEVLRIRKKVQGDRHPATLTAVSNLAATYVRQERLDEALKLVDEVIRTRSEVLGPNHRDTLTSRLILTNLYIRKKMWVEAEQTCIAVITGREKVLSENHPHTLWAKAHLALIHHHQGRLEESAEEWQEVIAKQQEARGAEHMWALLSMHNLALVCKSQGYSERALHLMEKVRDARSRTLGQEHFRTLESEQVLRRWIRMHDKPAEMEEPSPLAGDRVILSMGQAPAQGSCKYD